MPRVFLAAIRLGGTRRDLCGGYVPNPCLELFQPRRAGRRARRSRRRSGRGGDARFALTESPLLSQPCSSRFPLH